MRQTAEGHLNAQGDIHCPGCGRKGAESVPGGVEIRCERCKLEYQVDATLWEARTDYAIVEKLGQWMAAMKNFIEQREKRLATP